MIPFRELRAGRAAAWAWLLVALSAGCGSDPTVEGAPPVHLAVPWQGAQISCSAGGRADMGSRMSAALTIAGYPSPCALAVDPSTLSVTGTCPKITTGCFKPVILHYSMMGSSLRYDLGSLIGWVDLRPQALNADDTSLPVNLDVAGGAAQFVYTNNQLAALPGPPGADLCKNPGPALGLNDALIWASVYLAALGVDYNTVDSVSNLEHACAQTLP